MLALAHFALRVDRRPHPAGRAFKACDRLILAELTVFDSSQHGVQLVKVCLSDGEVTQEIQIERFRREIVERSGDARAGDNITDQELLREAMNTVSRQARTTWRCDPMRRFRLYAD